MLIYYCHKVKHIRFNNTARVLGTVRTESFEGYQIFIVVDNKSRIKIKKSRGISDLFTGCKHLTKLPINLTKFNEDSMEAKSQQNFYNKAAIVVISSIISLLSIHFQDLVQKVTKWLTIIHYFRFILCIAFTLSNNNLAHFHH